jgi:60 kDa SS-A/Ro ribonucleoprotein
MKVINALRDTKSLKAQRVHPLTLLVAQKTYINGQGVRGSLSWRPDQKVAQALDEAFYASFDNVEPTGKAYLLGIDVSGSMDHGVCAGCDVLTPRDAAAAMAMLTARTEDRSYTVAFSDTIKVLDISPADSLPAVIRKTRGLRFGRTRCAAAIEFATEQELGVDVFCLYTDNETNYGPHPVSALNDYRRNFNKDAKFAAFGFAQTSFSLADPNDCGMMDFVGFDTAAPTLLADFARN